MELLAWKMSITWLFFLIVVNFNHEFCNGLRILGIFPFNGKSHFIMSQRLLKALAERGHYVDVYSHYPLEKPVPNYTDYSLKGSLPDFTNNMTYSFASSFNYNPIFMVKHFIQTLILPTCELLDSPIFQKLIRDPPKYDLVVGETSFAQCHGAWGRHLNVSQIDIVPNVLPEWFHEALGNQVTPAVLPSQFQHYKEPNTFIDRLRNFVSYYGLTSLFHYHISSLNVYVRKHFGPDFPSVWRLPNDFALVLINHHYSLHGIMPFNPMIVPISGVHIEDKNETLPEILQNWLDESKQGFIYFSFGSMTRVETLPKQIIKAMYDAFESIAPVRVLWKVYKPEELPPNLPKNVMTQKWLQQQQILKHKNIIAFVTHGGLMGTLESIYFAVPMVGIPLFGDQHGNIMMYEEKKIAVKVHPHEIESKFKKALHEMIKNSIYKKNIEKISKEYRDSAISPLDTAIYWIEYIARHGKNALRSPIVDMPSWQVKLLDIYAFLLIIVSLALYSMKKLFQIMQCLFTSKSNDEKRIKLKKS